MSLPDSTAGQQTQCHCPSLDFPGDNGRLESAEQGQVELLGQDLTLAVRMDVGHVGCSYMTNLDLRQ
jgi:hypothetical protein